MLCGDVWPDGVMVFRCNSVMQWCVTWWCLAVVVSHSGIWHCFFMCLGVVAFCGDM